MKNKPITKRWLKIKKLLEENTNGKTEYGSNFPIDGELDTLCMELLRDLGEITDQNGFDYILEGVRLDIWKDRVWITIENAGLLEDIAWKTE